jgi:RNase P subunit RPR2
MYQDYGVDLKDIMTAVQCPDCLRKFAVRLSTNYLVRHKGEEFKVICRECGQKRIVEIGERE